MRPALESWSVCTGWGNAQVDVVADTECCGCCDGDGGTGEVFDNGVQGWGGL